MISNAAGFVIYHLSNPEPSFLLLRDTLTGAWEFPYGKINPNETLVEGAKRACVELTGIQAHDFNPEFSKLAEFELSDPKTQAPMEHKILCFFLHSNGQAPKNAIWAPKVEALNLLYYDALKQALLCALPNPGDLAKAQDLLNQMSGPNQAWRKHSIRVAQVAVSLGKLLLWKKPELPIPMEILEASALLHDIGRSVDHGAEHPQKGMELLMERGLGHLAKPCLSHWLKGRKRKELEKHKFFTKKKLDGFYGAFDLDNISVSEKIISVADALVQHDHPVRLEKRYQDARDRYGDSQWIRDNERISKEFIREFEQVLGGSIYPLLGIE